MNKIAISLYIIFVSISIKGYCQDLTLMEDSLTKLFDEVNRQNTIDKIDSCHQLFLEYFTESLQAENSFKYSFKKLSKIGKVTSDDKRVRCYSWNLFPRDGKYRYYSLIQIKNKDSNTNIIQLIDSNITSSIPEGTKLSTEEWYGALYYKIIKLNNEDRLQYIVLGWDGNNGKSTKKVIDVLEINADQSITLGAPIFYEQKQIKYRKVFEYSSKAKMTLDYDKKNKRIIFDHLIPIQSGYDGMFEFYGPDFSYDAFVLQEGKWIFKSNVKGKIK